MGKWSAFLVSLIPAGLAGYLCFLLVTIGLPLTEESAIMWGPIGAGFLGCVMCVLAPFGIAIFVSSAPKDAKKGEKKDEDEDDDLDIGEDDDEMLSDDEAETAGDEFTDDDLDSEDFESADDFSEDFESDDDFDFTDEETDEDDEDDFFK